jgi:zinc transport system substrate-binding protein
MRLGLVFALLFAIVEAPTEGRLNVAVSIPPQAQFVEKIAGERAVVDILLPPGQSPATYDLTPQQVVRLAQADVFFSIGVPFERQLVARFQNTLNKIVVVDTRKGITLRYFPGLHHRDVHGQGAPDPHVWLDPQAVKIQAATIGSTLIKLDSAHSSEYRENLTKFRQELDSVDTVIRRLLAPLKGSSIYVFHPAYGYFTDAYGLKQVAIEVEGKEPSARELAAFIKRARADNVQALFVQPQFSTSQAKMVAEEIGAKIVPLDPLARDYLTNIVDMAQKIAQNVGQRHD